MGALGKQHDPNEWRLFIKSSKLGFKSVLLHNVNKYPSVPIAHAAHTMDKSFGNMHYPVKHIQYYKYYWHIFGNLKVVMFLLRLQLVSKKFYCFF
jgi:hypothetical protein